MKNSTAFGSNCGPQLCAEKFSMTPFGNSFRGVTGKPFWELVFGSNCGEYLVLCEELRIADWYGYLYLYIFFKMNLTARVGLIFFYFLLNFLAY